MINGKSKYILVKEIIMHFRKNVTTEKNNNDQKIYVFIARISDNDEYPSRYFGDSLQLTNWILDSEATCHMTTKVSDFIPG